jgi:hypothetical protein
VKEHEKLQAAIFSPPIPLPPSATTTEIAQNYETIKDIIELLKEENSALDTAVNELFKHNTFIKSKSVENEQKLLRLLSSV